MIFSNCEVCGAEIKLYPSTINRKRFCGKKCLGKFMKTLTGEKNRRYGIKCSDKTKAKLSEMMTGKKGPNSPAWRGGGGIYGGYRYLYFESLSPKEQELFASMATKNKHAKYIAEHRLVVARRLGRPLTKEEKVHHVNGVKSDNRDANLSLTNDADHKKEHWKVLKEIKRLRIENMILREKLEAQSVSN